MGWNQLVRIRSSALTEGITNDSFAYFVHSYRADVGANVLAECDYGRPFAAIVGNGRVFGAQLHPERSADVGARLLRNFIGMSS